MIFLDIDGVLRIESPTGSDDRDTLRPNLVDNIRKIVKATNSKIVLSSAWRYCGLNKGARVHQSFKEAGGEDIYELIIDRTPLGYEVSGTRGYQIHSWLVDNDCHKEPFVIIDDSNDMIPHMDKLVHVDPTKGISEDNVKEAISILQKH